MVKFTVDSLPSEILEDMMFFMDLEEIYCFAQSCRRIYELFSELSCENLDRIRLEYLNGYSSLDRRKGSRLIDLFDNVGGYMWTYDDYMQKQNVKIVKEKIRPVYDHCRWFPNPDTYYLAFGEHVTRRVEKNEWGSKRKTETFEVTIKEKNDVYTEKSFYVDDRFRGRDENHFFHLEEKTAEKIVRLFRKPQEAKFADFMKRLSTVLESNKLLEILVETIFDFNKNTKSKTRFILAGGFMLHILTGCGCTDMDIFTIRNGESDLVIMQDLKTILLQFEEKIQKFSNIQYNILKTNGTINICPRIPQFRECIESYPPKPIQDKHLSAQFILRSIQSIEEIMVFFDIDCCRFCCDGVKVYTIMEGLRAIKFKINVIGREHIEKGMYYNRATKFGKRGFFTYFVDIHPLMHRLDFTYFIEQLKGKATELNNGNNYYDSMWGDCFGPLAGLYYSNEYRDANRTKDLDEANYYSVILRSVNYETIQTFIDEGIVAALDSLSESYIDGKWYHPGEERNYGMANELITKIEHHITKEDIHYFVESLKQLFSIDLSNYFLEGYFESHLREKYNFFKCYLCGKYIHHKTRLAYHDFTKIGSENNLDNRHSMCSHCKYFNTSISEHLYPSDLLSDKVAIVTGGRIKIGLQTALILLRLGARVIVTTRFASDALLKFQKCPDFSKWSERLSIYPLNLKDGKSVIEFTQYIKSNFKRIHILINNAAQTVKRPLEYYKPLLDLELKYLTSEEENTKSIITQNNSNLIENSIEITRTTESRITDKSLIEKYFPKGKKDKWGEQADYRPINSWNEKLSDVSVTEIVESQMINNVSPTILVSELFEILKPSFEEDSQDLEIDINHSVSFGHSFIINVTSHEGQFETSGKSDSHIQTNTSKASLNMLTRSCSEYYARNSILVNSVDTGWVSSALPVYRAPPLSDHDASCRILHPILSGSFKYGKLFKDYREVVW